MVRPDIMVHNPTAFLLTVVARRIRNHCVTQGNVQGISQAQQHALARLRHTATCVSRMCRAQTHFAHVGCQYIISDTRVSAFFTMVYATQEYTSCGRRYRQSRRGANAGLFLPEGVCASENLKFILLLTPLLPQTGESFRSLGQLELAETLFAQGAEDSAKIISQSMSPGDGELCLSLSCARARCAWSLQQHALATSSLEKAADILRAVQGSAPPATCADLAARLASSYIDLACTLLADDADSASSVPLLLSAVGVTAAARSTPAVWQQFDGRLHFKALRCLAVAHLKTSNPDLALTCARTMAADASALGQATDTVRDAAAAALQTAPFITIMSLCALGRLDEAEERLASVCRDSSASMASSPVLVNFIIDAISHVIKGGRPQAAAAAVVAVLKAVPDRTDAVVRFLDLTLGDGKPSGDVARDSALALLQSPECVAALKTKAQNETAGGPARQALSHSIAVMWNAATTDFEKKSYDAARQLFAAVMSYQLGEDFNRPKAARAACLCHLALRQPSEAMRYIRLADELESGGSPSVQTKFLMLKAHLECGGDDDDALKALAAMTQCADFEPDFMLLAALESQSAQALRCAQQAYTLMYGQYSSSGSVPPGAMAHLLRHLIKVTQAKWDAADAATVANQGSFERGRADELAQQFVVASERLEALGAVTFAGDNVANASKELSWFAITAWNAGLSTCAPQEGQHPAWAAAAHLFGAAGAFMNALVHMDPHGQHAPAVSPHTRQLAWLLSAASALEVHKDSGAQSLNEATLALQSAAAVDCPASDAARAQVFMLLTSFNVKARLGDAAGCLDMLRTAEAMPGLTADTALKLAKIAAEDAGLAVALRAYELCLRVMQRSQGQTTPNYADMAHVLRCTLTYAEQASGGSNGADSRDARLLRGFREASALIASVPAGGYPPEEAEWLMTQAWNRGAMLIKVGRTDIGEQFLKLGVELQRHCSKHSPQAEQHKAGMLDTLAQLSRKRSGTREGVADP